jgi:hypothetical protein
VYISCNLSLPVPAVIGKTMKGLFTCQEAKRDGLIAWLAESYDNMIESLSSKDILTYPD